MSGKVKSGKSTVFSKKIINLIRILVENPEGLRVRTMSKLLSSPKRTIYRHLNKLEKQRIIVNLYPIWKIQALSEKWQTLLKENEIQTHRFSFVLQLINKPYWWKNRAGNLMKIGWQHLNTNKWGNNKYQQYRYNGFIVQTFNSSIVFINQNKYWGSTAYDCLIQSLESTLELIRFMEEFYNFKFTKEGIPHMNIKSHEYVDIKDELAQRCKKSGKGFFVEIRGVKRVWVDYSIPFGLEFGSRLHAPEDQAKYKRYVNDIIENNAPLNSDLANELQELRQMVLEQNNIYKSMFRQDQDQLDKRDSYFG